MTVALFPGGNLGTEIKESSEIDNFQSMNNIGESNLNGSQKNIERRFQWLLLLVYIYSGFLLVETLMKRNF